MIVFMADFHFTGLCARNPVRAREFHVNETRQTPLPELDADVSDHVGHQALRQFHKTPNPKFEKRVSSAP